MAEGWMVFVDGENFAIRGRAVAAAAQVALPSCEAHQPDTFLWMPDHRVEKIANPMRLYPYHDLDMRRAFYYTAVQGDDDLVGRTRRQINQFGFQPRVFKKAAGKRAKRVDIMLATEALSNAHLRNYDAAVLITGDEDYVPLVEEIQRMGRIVIVGFFSGPKSGLSEEVMLRADHFISFNEYFLQTWRLANNKAKR